MMMYPLLPIRSQPHRERSHPTQHFLIAVCPSSVPFCFLPTKIETVDFLLQYVTGTTRVKGQVSTLWSSEVKFIVGTYYFHVSFTILPKKCS